MCFWWEIYYQLQENSWARIKNIVHLFNFFYFIYLMRGLYIQISVKAYSFEIIIKLQTHLCYIKMSQSNIVTSKIKFWGLLLNQWAWCIFGISKAHFMDASSNFFIYPNLYENNMSLLYHTLEKVQFQRRSKFSWGVDDLMTASGSNCFLLVTGQLHFKLWN